MSDSWHTAEKGSTLGQTGSEQGVIQRDEEHALGARIALERGCPETPFAVTCGIYGWMVHTRFFGEQAEAEAQYEAMKKSIAELLDAAESADGEDGRDQMLRDGVGTFLEVYP